MPDSNLNWWSVVLAGGRQATVDSIAWYITETNNLYPLGAIGFVLEIFKGGYFLLGGLLNRWLESL